MGESQEVLNQISDILERMTDAFFALDEKWRFTYVNQEASRLLFRHRVDLLGKLIWAEFPEAAGSEFQRQYERAMSEQVSVAFEQYYEPLQTWFEVRSYPSATGISVYFRDITSEKHQQRLQEQYYQSLFDKNPDWVYSLRLDGQFQSVNSALTKGIGYSEDQLLNMNFAAIIYAEDLDVVGQRVDAVCKGTPQTYETRVTHQDGSILYLSLTMLPILVDGEVTAVYGIAKNITERQLLEQKLEENKQRYESLKRYNPNGICSLDLQNKLMNANPAFVAITGYTVAELRTMRLSEILYPEDVEWARQVFVSATPLHRVERKIRRKTGQRVDVSITTVPIIIGEQKKGTYVILEDISSTNQVRHRLIETERRYQLISENSSDIILDLSADGVCQYVSPSVQLLLGYQQDEIVGRCSLGLFHPDDRDYVKSIGLRLLQGEDISRFTCRMKLKNGNYLWYETTLRVVRTETGELLRVVGVGRDVSERMQIQESLEQAVRIGGLGHWEWHVPAATIKLSTQMHEILGWVPREVSYRPSELAKVVHPEDAELLKQTFKRSLDMGSPLERELRIVRRDGSIRYLKCQGEVLLNDLGEPVLIVGTCQDVTAWKHSEHMLQQSEQRYQRLVENSLDAVAIFEDWKWVFLNRTGLKLFGAKSEEELLGKSLFDFLHPDYHEEVRLRVELILFGEKVDVMQQKWFKINGDILLLDVRGALFNESAVQVVFHEISEQKKES